MAISNEDEILGANDIYVEGNTFKNISDAIDRAQDGDIIQSRFAVERRNRTIHSRMREYLYTLTHHEQLTTSLLPLGDGVTLSVKK